MAQQVLVPQELVLELEVLLVPVLGRVRQTLVVASMWRQLPGEVEMA
jgi:hypothetical protein